MIRPAVNARALVACLLAPPPQQGGEGGEAEVERQADEETADSRRSTEIRRHRGLVLDKRRTDRCDQGHGKEYRHGIVEGGPAAQEILTAF
ncbi:hypothetical protein [Frankia sp. CcWB3]